LVKFSYSFKWKTNPEIIDVNKKSIDKYKTLKVSTSLAYKDGNILKITGLNFIFFINLLFKITQNELTAHIVIIE
tara:strand:+ start:314 stop:538 length:225 start_codon:yes stop_codon:yes gene_type:complete